MEDVVPFSNKRSDTQGTEISHVPAGKESKNDSVSSDERKRRSQIPKVTKLSNR